MNRDIISHILFGAVQFRIIVSLSRVVLRIKLINTHKAIMSALPYKHSIMVSVIII